MKETENRKAPDLKGDGVAVWINQTKEGKPYLSINMVGHNVVNVFKNEPKPVINKDAVLNELDLNKRW